MASKGALGNSTATCGRAWLAFGLLATLACVRGTSEPASRVAATIRAREVVQAVLAIPELRPRESGFVSLRAIEAVTPKRADESLRLSIAGLFVAELTALDVASVAAVEVDGATVFVDAAPDLDIVTLRTAYRFEEVRRLRSPAAPRVGRYRLRLASGTTARARGDRVEILEKGAVVLETAAAFAVDARGVRRTVHLRLEGDLLETSFDAAGLSYPVLVDPAWLAAASMPFGARAPMIALVLKDGRGLLADDKSATLYDPVQKTFADVSPPLGPVSFDAAAVLPSGKVIFPGGRVVGDGASTAQLFDPTTKTWTAGPSMANRHREHTATALTDGRVVVIGSHSPFTGGTSSVEIFDESTGAWTNGPNLTRRRGGHTAIRLGSGKVLIFGGQDDATDDLSFAEVIDATASTATRTADAPSWVPVPATPGTLLPSGKVLFTHKSFAEIYDPTLDTWATASVAPKLLQGFTLTTLASGKVLLAGGFVNDLSGNTYESGAYLFDETAGSWTATSSMASPRSEHGALLLPSVGTVLVAGGSVGAGGVSSAELYRPGDLATAASCTNDGECASGFCVDGVCCATACNGLCEACSAATKTTGASGTCGPAKAATDPHETCKDDGAPSCNKNGLCNGSGACATYGAATCAARACTKDADCTSGFCTDGICCDKRCSGACESCRASVKGAGADGTCGPVPAGVDPRSLCVVDPGFPANCKSDGKCDGAGACRTVAPINTSCGSSSCAAGMSKAPICDGTGVCGDNAQTCGAFACDAAGLVCATTCTMDGQCSANAYCAGSACAGKKPNGEPATDGRECESGIVADGVCCNAACSGICEACDVAATKGTCTAVKGAAKHGTCPPGTSDMCSPSSCDGAARTTCAAFPGPEVTCRPRSCTDAVELLPSKCAGTGTCPPQEQKVCDPYACEGTQCRTSCRSDFDCKAGVTCDVVSHNCTGGPACDGDHTVVSPSGPALDCSPLKCGGGKCLESCKSSTDCVVGFVCDPATKSCVTSAQAPIADDGGCATAAPGSRPEHSETCVVLAALVGAIGLRSHRSRRTLRAFRASDAS